MSSCPSNRIQRRALGLSPLRRLLFSYSYLLPGFSYLHHLRILVLIFTSYSLVVLFNPSIIRCKSSSLLASIAWSFASSMSLYQLSSHLYSFFCVHVHVGLLPTSRSRISETGSQIFGQKFLCDL